ncbi:MAG: ABC transporter substrate-binding protein [Planctomycetota bacterium]
MKMFGDIRSETLLRHVVLLVVAASLLATSTAQAQSFEELVGPVKVGEVKKASQVQVPFITWGGDVATFQANGGLQTKKGSLYSDLGLDIKLTPGDDFVQQVRNYMSGDTPLLRGTLRMIGQASGVIGSNPKTKPVVFMQLTWSAGDHIVSRGHVKTLNDLKGKKVVLQQGGPHVGMLDDALRAAQLSWDDIEVVWVDQLTGPGGPAEVFAKDKSIDACAVISPDMIGLTGGLDAVGSGAEGTVKDARVLVSTAQMSRSIADVYVCRKDWYDANREWVDKFVAGYFKASEDVAAMRNSFEETGKGKEYLQTLKRAQDILGEDVLPTLEIDAHGLLLDCTFVGLPGNRAFFEDKSNLSGFEAKQRQALDLATSRGYAKVRAGFFAPNLNYDRIATLGKLTKTTASGQGRIAAEAIDVFPGEEALDENTILAFTINFEPNQNEFSAEVYGPEFLRAVENASTFGNAVVAIRGHSDPTKTLVDLVKSGLNKGILTRAGQPGNYRYYFNGKSLDLTDTGELVKLVQSGAFDGDANANPRETMQAALNLSRSRAVAVRDAVIQYAQDQGYKLDASQIQPLGVGVGEPLIAKPTNMNEARENMRVEFRLVKVPAEVVSPSDFDF